MLRFLPGPADSLNPLPNGASTKPRSKLPRDILSFLPIHHLIPLGCIRHILQCTRDLDSIKPGGDGFRSSVSVRLLHSNVRKRILKLHSQHPKYYSLEEFGIPINDMDSIMTIMTFSSSLIWISLPRQGVFMREQE